LAIFLSQDEFSFGQIQGGQGRVDPLPAVLLPCMAFRDRRGRLRGDLPEVTPAPETLDRIYHLALEDFFVEPDFSYRQDNAPIIR